MSGFPLPPHLRVKSESGVPSIIPKIEYPSEQNAQDVTPAEETKDAEELSLNEYCFILDSTLSKRHRKDEVVIAFIDSFIRCKSIAQASAECDIAPSLGYIIRHKADVANAIQKLIDRHTVKYGFDASEIMERTKEIVDFDPISMMNRDGTYKKNLHEIEPEARRSLKKMKARNLYKNVKDINGILNKIIVGELIEYEFYDKLKAVELVGREKDMFSSNVKHEHSMTKDMAHILLASAQRGERAKLDFKNVVEVSHHNKYVSDDTESDEITEDDDL